MSSLTSSPRKLNQEEQKRTLATIWKARQTFFKVTVQNIKSFIIKVLVRAIDVDGITLIKLSFFDWEYFVNIFVYFI